MFKLYVSIVLILLINTSIWAQESNSDYSSKPSTHYLGLQTNELLREILNFGGSRSQIVNPYLLIFNVNSKKNQSGINLGLGYNSRKINDENDDIIRDTEVKSFDLRFGYDKKFMLNDKLMTSLGIDVLFGKQKDVTKTENEFNGKIEIENKQNKLGIGPRFTFSYYISEKVILMTESSYYFTSIKTKNKSSFQGQPRETSSKESNMTFNAPLVLYLVFKF